MPEPDLISPDPFNHGECRLRYVPVSDEEREPLIRILRASWPVTDVHGIKAFDRPTPYSNAFVVDTAEGSIVLRACKTLDEDKQQVVDASKQYAADEGLPVPLPWTAANGKTWVPDGTLIYSVCDFIDGEHFDGARENLEASARLLARFHQVFLDYPEVDKVRRVSGDVYPRDEIKWSNLKRAAREGHEPFDRVAEDWMALVDAEEPKFATSFEQLPRQLGHFDWHPHNLLFARGERAVIGLLDFDLMRHAERARDVALGMHKFSRVFGEKTVRKCDVGARVDDRCAQFLEAYQDIIPLTKEEILLLPDMLFDEAKRKLIYIFGRHYFLDNPSSDFDLEKHIVQMFELESIAQRLKESL